MSRSPDVQRRLRFGPILPAEAERRRWLAVPLIRWMSEMETPWWVGDLICLYMIFQLARVLA